MFDIAFTADTPVRDGEGDEAWDGLRGRVTLGDDTEGFRASLYVWGRGQYERQWAEAAGRLLGPPARAGFFTSHFQFWWVMWREGEVVFAQEHYLTPETLAGVSRAGAAPYHLIGDRTTWSGDEELPISEWQVTADDIRAFTLRRAGYAE